jgi:hypothetical protein
LDLSPEKGKMSKLFSLEKRNLGEVYVIWKKRFYQEGEFARAYDIRFFAN